MLSFFIKILKRYSPERIKSGLIRRIRKIYKKPLSVRVLVNSIPKSGTNLLKGTLFYLLDTEEFFHVDATMPAKKIQDILINKSKEGIITAHLFYRPGLLDLLKELDFKVFLIIRDLRDVVVSYFLYRTYTKEDEKNSSSLSESYYYKNLPNDEERLLRAILKFWLGEKNIGEVYEAYKPWFNCNDILVVRYENLIGPEGGGDRESQIKEIKRIVDYLGLEINSQKIQEVARKIFYRKSAKFRKGQIGDWKNHFNEEHKKVFKKVAGQILIDLGYEKDFNW